MTFWGSRVGSWMLGRPGPDEAGEPAGDADVGGDGAGDGACAAVAGATDSRRAVTPPSRILRNRFTYWTKLAARLTIGRARNPRMTPMIARTMRALPASC